MNLSNIGDLSLRRRIVTMLRYLELEPGLDVLDAGCGDGLYSRIIEENFQPHLIVAVDSSSNVIQLQQRFPSIFFLTKDIQTPNFLKGVGLDHIRFDRILCTEVLEHVDDPIAALRELYRVLKPGGVLAVTVPNTNYPFLWDPISWCLEAVGIQPRSGMWNMHKRLYDYCDIGQTCESVGFVVEKVELLTHYCIPFSMQILRIGALLKSRIPIPGTDRHGDEPGRWNPLRWALSVFEWADRRNDRPEAMWSRLNFLYQYRGFPHFHFMTSVNIALKLRKPT